MAAYCSGQKVVPRAEGGTQASSPLPPSLLPLAGTSLMFLHFPLSLLEFFFR